MVFAQISKFQKYILNVFLVIQNYVIKNKIPLIFATFGE
jgi:hypothetical protein